MDDAWEDTEGDGFFDGCTLVADLADAACEYDSPHRVVSMVTKIVEALGGVAGLDGRGVGRCVIVGISHQCDVPRCEALFEEAGYSQITFAYDGEVIPLLPNM